MKLITSDKIVNLVYRKTTVSEQNISYFSICAFRFKINAIKKLIYMLLIIYRLKTTFYFANSSSYNCFVIAMVFL